MAAGSRPLLRLLPALLALAAALPLLLWLLGQYQRREPPAVQSTPLQRGEAASAPRFQRRRGFETGIVFQNRLEPHNSYTYLTNGAGMAVGDYDRDGLPDLYFVAQDGPNVLYRQVAPLRFVDVTAAAGNVDGGAAWGTGATFVDVDGDGWLDLYVCNMEAKNLLYRNRGDGTFEECAARFGLDLTAASTMAAFCDYDRDGDLDLYLLTNRALHAGWALTPEVLDGIEPPADTARRPRDMVPSQQDLTGPLARWFFGGEEFRARADALPERLREHFFDYAGRLYMAGQPDRLLRNDGGVFVDVTQSAGIRGQGMGLSATWWDYDGDGWPDLYVANDLESPDLLWRNQGDGTFVDVTQDLLPHTAYYGMGSDAGDIDNDGRLDFFVGDMSATTHRMAKVLMGDMSRQRHFLIHARPQQYMRNALLLNTGAGRFREGAFLAGVASTDWTWSTLFGDLDNDGRLDLFVSNGIARFDMDPDLELRVRALWQQGRQRAAIEEIRNVRRVPERNLALRNAGDLRFEPTGADWALDFQGISHGAVLCDLDRDGDLDVVTNNWNEEAGLWENTGGGHSVAFELLGRDRNPFGVGARIEITTAEGLQLRENWLSRGYQSGQEPRVHFGLPTSAPLQQVVVHWPSGAVSRLQGLAADHLHRIAEPATRPAGSLAPRTEPPVAALFAPNGKGPRFRHREREYDDYEQQFLLPHKLSQLGPGLAFGDADGDGQDELFVGGAAGQPGALFTRAGTAWREVEGPWRDDAECEDMGVLWLDYDGDGDQDLFVVSGGVEAPAGSALYRDRLYRNEGGLRFVRDYDALPDLRDSGGPCCAADIDGDGDLDLFVGTRLLPGAFPDSSPSRLFRNEGGRFVDATSELAPALLSAGMVTGAVFSSVRGDRYPDLLLAAQWQPVRYLRNMDGRRFEDATAAAGLLPHRGLWNSIAALDADGDGDIDFLVGNLGRNTKYKASAEHPLGLLFADFDGDGSRDLVETKYEGDRLLPVRGRSCSSQAMPFLAQKFPTYEQFANSVLQEIYPQDKLRQAGRLEATVLDSVWLRNDGDGRFALVPLPRRAQLAPLFGLAIADFDGDGRDDAVCGTNFFSPEPETGRFDGGLGLLLRGSGSGLLAVEPRAAGIAHFGDHKGVAASDLDGDGRPDVVIASNDDELVVLQNRSAAPQLCVRLQGPRGNPTGVGAVVTVQRADGSGERRAVRAGDGYLSQSSAALWFPRGPSPIQAVLVRWPNGTDSRIEQDLDAATLTVRQP